MFFAILAAVSSAALHPFFPIFARRGANPLTVNFWGILVATAIFSFIFFRENFWQRVADHWILILLAGMLHAGYTILSLRLLSRNEFQILYPLTRLAPILILFGEIFWFGTKFSATQILGILAVMAGALIFGFDRKIEHIRAKVFTGIVAITILTAGFYLADKKLLEIFTPAEMWALVIFQIPMEIWIFCIWRREAVADLRNFKNLIGYAAAMIGTWLLALHALSFLDAAVVASIRNLSILFGIFLGAHLFDEGHRFWRYFAAGLIVGGVFFAI